jgi:hypothetical protein
MKNRNPILVLILIFVTCGFYGIYWYVSTKEEMKKLGADIPTAWLLIIPLVNLWWLWRWARGVEQATRGDWKAMPAFLLCWLVGFVGIPLTQSHFNKVAAPPPPA